MKKNYLKLKIIFISFIGLLVSQIIIFTTSFDYILWYVFFGFLSVMIVTGILFLFTNRTDAKSKNEGLKKLMNPKNSTSPLYAFNKKH